MSGSYSGNENEEYGNGRNVRKGLTTPPAKQIQLLSSKYQAYKYFMVMYLDFV